MAALQVREKILFHDELLLFTVSMLWTWHRSINSPTVIAYRFSGAVA